MLRETLQYLNNKGSLPAILAVETSNVSFTHPSNLLFSEPYSSGIPVSSALDAYAFLSTILDTLLASLPMRRGAKMLSIGLMARFRRMESLRPKYSITSMP